MNQQTFSKMLCSAEGRFLTSLEQEQLTAAALELPHRMLVSSALQQAEFAIVDYATQAFCDTIADFDGGVGSLRRKKGHQDGRIILRYLAQAIREGSPDVLFEKVMSWLVGHLDNANVLGRHFEVFFHFLQQGARRELPAPMHPFIDAAFNELLGYVRRGSYSGEIHRAHRRIAEWAVDRLVEILPEAKTRYGVAGISKCRRDFELLVKEVARAVKAPSLTSSKRQLANWLVERLMSQVEYSPDVWYWSFMVIREAIVDCCGPEAAMSVSELLETMADRAQELVHSVELCNRAGEAADLTAKRLLERGEPLGLLRVDEFQTTVSMVNRQIIQELAVLCIAGNLHDQQDALTELWQKTVLPTMPSNQTTLLAANLKVLLEVVSELSSEATAKSFRTSILTLVDIARRCEAASRIAAIADKSAVQAADWVLDNLPAFTADRRAAYRDLRLVLSRIVSLIAAGPASGNLHEFGQYLARYLLPNLPFNSMLLKQVYERLQKSVDANASADDAKLVRSYLDEAFQCFERHYRLQPLRSALDRIAASAVERGYQAAPRHETLQRNGVRAGRRDGRFLIERAIEAAVIGGATAEADFHQQFMEEQVRHCNLPGAVLVEFIRGFVEQVRDYPEVTELLLGLAHAAPLYAASLKINHHSSEWAQQISEQIFATNTVYRQTGDAGLEACKRDNGVMLRGLARHLQAAPADVGQFKFWWRRHIGKNIRTVPENLEGDSPTTRIHLDQVIATVQAGLEPVEGEAVVGYLRQLIDHRASERSNQTPINARRIPNLVATAPITFADVGV